MSEELDRVGQRIQGAIVGFFADLGPGAMFYADTLRSMCAEVCGEVAPDSPGRVMRELRRQGIINYRVVSRTQSLYEVVASE